MEVGHWQSDMNLPWPAETIVRPFTTFPCLWRMIKVPHPNHKRCCSSSCPLMWRFTWPPLPSTLFWAKRGGKQTTCVYENTTYQSHQKGPGKQSGRLAAWDKHSHKSLRSLSRVSCCGLRRRGLFTLVYVHCKGQSQTSFQHTHKQADLCAVRRTMCTHQKEHRVGLLSHNAPCGTSFSPHTDRTPSLPTLGHKLTINKG